jgi:hypothetical protein
MSMTFDETVQPHLYDFAVDQNNKVEYKNKL